MGLDPHLVLGFRRDIQRSREADRVAWEESSRLVARARLPETTRQLARAIRVSSIADPLREELLACLDDDALPIRGTGHDVRLKALTGLPLSKAIRALSVHFGLLSPRKDAESDAELPASDIEGLARRHANPYDLLLRTQSPSVLDLGAGDLSFANELVERYLAGVRQAGTSLTVHCIERLSPGSRWGSRLHADPQRLARLRDATADLSFLFWPGQDMFALDSLEGHRDRYTIAVCNAPATPTFAYEPTRLSPEVIAGHLAETKGRFRKVRIEGEEALEVVHRGRALIFPPWKFDVRGPLALLDLMARRAQLCLLTAVDNEVFWELLAQLLADEQVRPRDRLFTPDVLPQVFGPLYAKLAGLPLGHRLDLATLAALRPRIPRVLPRGRHLEPVFGFRYVEVRRGAQLSGIPAGSTAGLYQTMAEEAPPWFLTLVPESH